MTTNELLRKLKPCPFCGGTPAHEEVYALRQRRIRCEKCGASTAAYPYAVRAAEAWERRA